MGAKAGLSGRAGEAGPPPGSPWDDPLEEAPLVFVDLEMTGLDARRDRVIEVCLVRERGGRVEGELTTLVRPEDLRAEAALGAAHVHGIDAASLAGAPSFPEVAGRIRALLEGAVLVAHAAEHDVAFLEAEFARAALPFRVGFALDTLTLCRRAFSLPSYGLAAVAAHLGVSAGRSHRAGDDVETTRRIFRRLVTALSPTSPRDLWHVRVGAGHARPEIVEAAREAMRSGATVALRYRPSRRPPEEYVMRLTEVVDAEEPPRVVGYLVSSRARRELRADRILALEPAAPGEAPGGKRPA